MNVNLQQRTNAPIGWRVEPEAPPGEQAKARITNAFHDFVGPGGWRSALGPALFAIAAVGLLVYDHLQQRLTEAVFWLGMALILAVFLRMLETTRKQSETIRWQQRSALHDTVTGLRNRTGLRDDLEAALADPGIRQVLVLLELDGFQAYTDRFGDSAGDSLLQRVSERLVSATTGLAGHCYRVDTSRLCVLAPEGENGLGQVVTVTTAALDEDDEDRLIGRSYGEVTLPDEAGDLDSAMHIAGERLAARKQRQHRSARRQAHAVLMAVLRARRPHLRDHTQSVAYRAITLSRRLGIENEPLDDIALAAGVQDVGMLAVPETILEKPDSLTDHDLELIRRHPLEGERIVASAPGLAPVAALVRSSYERYDGSGYPDGLAGDDIPIGARIISVAVAFAAITSPRPHSEAINVAEALLELRRCAGTQFDPRVVEALAVDLAEEGSSQPAPVAT